MEVLKTLSRELDDECLELLQELAGGKLVTNRTTVATRIALGSTAQLQHESKLIKQNW